jgi:hypothetical protein
MMYLSQHSRSACLAATSVVLGLAMFAGATQQDTAQAKARVAGTVDAVVVDAIAPTWAGPAADGPALRPNHPPIDEIPFMPMPEPGAPGGPWAPNTVAVHDAQTGNTMEIPAGPGTEGLGGSGAGFNGIDDAQSFEDGLRTFGDMFQITNTDDFPWRMNCKLVMRFVDQGGNDRWFVASGSMQDAETVLTAAHCVYARNPNGINIWDWAEEIWVYPGWDGVGNQWSEPSGVINPYGWARGTYYLAGSDYINNGNFDRDMGLIRLTRGVGMLTGWYGWAWGFGCGDIQDRLYNNPSFPAENCPTAGLHNGRDMYNWNGYFDSCPGNQLQIDTGGGNCFDTLWGGMSGSAAYYFNDGGSRLAHAVASNSNRTTIGRYTKMWEQFKDDMIDFENGSRGSSFDLQALRTRVSPSSVTAGASLTDRSHLAINPTNGTKNSNFEFEVYLSSNSNISTSDTLLSTQFYSWDFDEMSSVNINMAGITIPKNTPSGDYWVGVVYDDATDGVTSNNDSDDWDADPITVNGIADIVANSVNAPSGEFEVGDSMNVSFNVTNDGGDPSNTVTVDIRLSINTTITTSDPLAGSYTFSGLPGGGTINTSRTVSIPNVAPGLYFVGIIATSSDDADGSNNTEVDRVQIRVVEPGCPEDLDGDGDVDISDLGILLAAFEVNDGGDIDGDGDTDISDLGALLAAFEQPCG